MGIQVKNWGKPIRVRDVPDIHVWNRAKQELGDGLPLLPLVEIWLNVLVVVSNKKISKLKSGFPPVRSSLDMRAIRVPSRLIEALEFGLPVESVIWLNVAAGPRSP